LLLHLKLSLILKGDNVLVLSGRLRLNLSDHVGLLLLLLLLKM
jgi:hypothetical protein